jgi:hypothetical protein
MSAANKERVHKSSSLPSCTSRPFLPPRFQAEFGNEGRTAAPTPTGLISFSPGLAHQRLPWVLDKSGSNPERVDSRATPARFNPFRVGLAFLSEPRVGTRDARSNPGLNDPILSGLPKRGREPALPSPMTNLHLLAPKLYLAALHDPREVVLRPSFCLLVPELRL